MKEIAKKLKQLRTERGLSGDEVAKRLGKSGNHVISRIESGDTKLNLDTFTKLCDIYEVSPASLFKEKKEFRRKKGFFDRISYRSEENDIPESLKQEMLPYLKDLRRIGSLQKKLDQLPFDYKEIYKVEINRNLSQKKQKEIAKALARNLRKKLEIDEHDEIDIVDIILNHLNIPILGIDMGETMWGFYSKDIYSFPLIVFNSNNKFEGRKRFTLAHELGHYFLHNDYFEIDLDGGKRDDSEYVVDAFAQELLVPEAFFRKSFDEMGLSLVKDIKPFHIAMLANKFKVSFLMITYLLADLGKITWPKYRTLKDYCLNKLEDEKEDIGYTDSDYAVEVKPLKYKLRKLALKAKVTKLIGEDELSKLTGMSIEEIARVL